jgi:D-alanyl-lipoteichoic acid acyltransferase DltB (MBOAT superfamily)
MLFNSYAFIYLFLPITFAGYFVLNRKKLILAAKTWLVLASLFFYGYWNPIYILLILGSIVFNYAVGSTLIRKRGSPVSSRLMLFVGIAGNLSLLVYFKYMDFFIANINAVSSLNLKLLHITLPLGISFLTFTQIAYLVDAAKGMVREHNFVNYSLFIAFFPRLLVGPIVRHREIIPQFDALRNKLLNYKYIAQGLTLLFLGLFKKVVIADRLADWANTGFDTAASLTFLEAWITSLSYTLQLYFDFSGYTDMALGASLLFNIKLPVNFNSPYRSLTIQEFWRRWHMTLSRFIRDYIYIPLGGSRASEPRILLNILVTFFLVGLWHGAGWTFVIWGLLHGCALAIFRFWQKGSFRLPRFVSWFITFNFINAAWVFFRAQTFSDAMKVLKGMTGLTGVILPERFAHFLAALKGYGIQFGNRLPTIQWDGRMFCYFVVFFILAVLFKNSGEIIERLKPNWRTVVALSLILVISILNLNKTNEFIYFNF